MFTEELKREWEFYASKGLAFPRTLPPNLQVLLKDVQHRLSTVSDFLYRKTKCAAMVYNAHLTNYGRQRPEPLAIFL